MDAKKAQQIVRESGLESALPFFIVEADKKIVFINARMKELLTPSGKAVLKSIDELEKIWPFFNEFQGPPAFFASLIKADAENEKSQTFYAEAYLKTYRFHVRVQGVFRVIVAELVRSGDLLEDKEARQALFRSLSHEIRTSVMALVGYTQILKDKHAESQLELDGMRNALSRLESVVRRLDDFKAELEK